MCVYSTYTHLKGVDMNSVPEWLKYEHQMIEEHKERVPDDADVYHWTHTPETLLEECGYVTDRNRWRLCRKRRYE